MDDRSHIKNQVWSTRSLRKNSSSDGYPPKVGVRARSLWARSEEARPGTRLRVLAQRRDIQRSYVDDEPTQIHEFRSRSNPEEFLRRLIARTVPGTHGIRIRVRKEEPRINADKI